jgi:excisionase family DNA binding protein
MTEITSEFIEVFIKVAKAAETLSMMSTREVEVALERIKLINDSLVKYGDIASIIEHAKEIESKIYQCKDVLTLEEAAKYVGHTKSLLYKWTSNREITHYKPTGKAIFIERSELDSLLLTNPIYSNRELDRMNRAQELERKNKRRMTK